MILLFCFWLKAKSQNIQNQSAKTYSNSCLRDSSCSFELGYDDVNQVYFFYKTNRYLYSHDVNGNITNTLLLGRNFIDSSWINLGNFVNTYSGNKLIDSLYQYWDNGTNQWINNSKQILTYDSNGNLVSATDQFHGSGAWLNYTRTLDFYDTNNKQILSKIQYWNTNFNLWLNTDSINYKYDINNKVHSHSYYRAYNGTSNYWTYDAKDTIHYNIAGNPIYSLKKNWDNFNLGWTDSYRNIWTYDANNRLIHRVTDAWNGGFNIWNIFVDDYYSYDINNNVTLDSSYQLRHYNTCSVAGIGEKNKTFEFSIYPNPTNSSLSINSSLDYNSIKIINSIGQTIITKENKSAPISVSNLIDGIYFIQLFDKKGIVLKTEKFIKE